jgi:hypothetical protein
MRIASTTLLLTVLGALAFSPAFSAEQQTASVKTDDTVLNIRFGAAHIDMDVANGLGTVIDTSGFEFIAQPDNGVEMSAAGLELSGDFWSQGSSLGGIYVGASLLDVSVDNNSVLKLPSSGAPYLDSLPIDGSLSTGAIIPTAGAEANISTSSDFYRIAGSAGYALPSMMEGTNLAVGLYGGYSRLNFDATTRAVVSGNFATLSEDVRTVSVGPMVALQKTFELTNAVEGFVEGQAALLYARGNLDASQVVSNIARISLSSRDNDIAGMVEARTGVSFRGTGGSKFSLFGGLGVRNDVYKIVNPRSAPGLDANDPSSYKPGPATIRQTVQFSASIGASFAIQF